MRSRRPSLVAAEDAAVPFSLGAFDAVTSLLRGVTQEGGQVAFHVGEGASRDALRGLLAAYIASERLMPPEFADAWLRMVEPPDAPLPHIYVTANANDSVGSGVEARSEGIGTAEISAGGAGGGSLGVLDNGSAWN